MLGKWKFKHEWGKMLIVVPRYRFIIVGNVFRSIRQVVFDVRQYFCTIVGNTIHDYCLDAYICAIYLYNAHSTVLKGNVIYSESTNATTYSIYEAGSTNDNIIAYNRVDKPIYYVGANTVVRRNIGYTTENSGIATITGDGLTTTFVVNIAHGLVSDKLTTRITPGRDGTVDKVYLVDADGDEFKETIRV